MRTPSSGAFICRRSPVPLCDAPLNTLETGWGYVYEFVLPQNAAQTAGDIAKCQIDRTAMAHFATTYAFPLYLSTDLTIVRTGTAIQIAPETQDEATLLTGVLGTIYYGHHEDF